MWALFNYDKFPIIHVSFQSELHKDSDFKLFLDEWRLNNSKQKPFTFIFDTSQVSIASIKYSYQMTQFIEECKQLQYNYLQKSIIFTNSNFVKYMLSLIFTIQKPISPVYITESKDEIENILQNKIKESVQSIYP